MNKVLLIIILIFGNISFHAQNLLPNPSFENFSECPAHVDQIYFAPPWNSATSGTPDLFNACSDNPFITVPGAGRHADGYQEARTGEGFAGLFVYAADSPIGLGEYIQAPLIKTLEKGRNYYLEFFIAIDYSAFFAQTYTDEIGMAFTSNPLDTVLEDTNHLDLYPVLRNKQGIIDINDKWYHISGCYEAQGEETNVILGAFKPLQEIKVRKDDPEESPNFNYFYLEDVGVYEFDFLPDSILICEETEITLDAFSENTSYAWSTGESESSITVNSTGLYEVTMTRGACTFVDHVKIVKECDCEVFVPNVFSPNNDGVNDEIELGFECGDNLTSVKFTLYDRYGNVMVESSELASVPILYDMASGVYTYTLNFEYETVGESFSKFKVGTITAIK